MPRRSETLSLIHISAQLAALFNVGWLTAVADAISTGWVNWILTVLLIVFFAYFYTSMAVSYTHLSTARCSVVP